MRDKPAERANVARKGSMDMTDFNSIGRGGQPLRPERIQDPVQQTQTSTQPDSATSTAKAAIRDEVSLSTALQDSGRGDSFDAGRVADIRAELERGSYPLDARRIAESFIALEQLISSTPSPGAGSN